MPVCGKCNTYNNLERKTCKKCGQALIIEEGNVCRVCSAVNGPFAKKCRECGADLSSTIKKQGEGSVGNGISHDTNKELSRFYDLLKSSYLYDNENNTFAEEEFKVKILDEEIYFTLGNSSYIFQNADELEYIFYIDEYPIPDFIRANASRLIRSVFEKCSKGSSIRLLDDTLGDDDYLLCYANEKGQLAVTDFLPIYEHEINELIPKLIDVCHNSNQFLCKYQNDMFAELIGTMDSYHYHYELIKGDGEEFVYKVGEKTITIHIFEDGESLEISYLNKHLNLTMNDKEFISIIFINWMFNIVIEPLTIGERMKQFFNKSTGIVGKLKGYLNKNLYTTHYSLTENDNLVLNVVSENIVTFTFKELKAKVTVPIHPNMPYSEFDKMLEIYIKLANNKDLIQYINSIENSTNNTVIISDVSVNGCKIYVQTEHTLLSTLILNSDTTYAEVTKFINKINFIEQIVQCE